MSTQHFRDWAQHHGIELSQPLVKEDWNKKIIGIDAEEFLNNLLTTSQTREPLLPALGGLPFALENHLQTTIDNFSKIGANPFFVFNGLDTAVHDRATVAKECEKAARSLDEAWKQYDATKADDAVAEFGRSCKLFTRMRGNAGGLTLKERKLARYAVYSTNSQDAGTYQTKNILRWMQGYLHRASVMIQIAPYRAAAQLVYYESAEACDGVWGSAAVLAFGGDRVITDFDFASETFSWVDTSACVEKLQCRDQQQFVDACLLAGFSLLPVIPEIENADLKLDAAMELMRRSSPNKETQDGYFACLRANDEDYTALFKKARFAIKHHIYLAKDSNFVIKDRDHCPHDIHECMGQRLPDELMYYLTRGLAGSRILNWRTKLEVFEVPPLDGGDSQAYRNLVQDKLLPMRAQALALGTSSLHFYYQKTDVNAMMWFNEGVKKPLDVVGISEPTKVSDSWHVKVAGVFGRPDFEKVGSKAWLVLQNDIDFRLQILGAPESIALALSLLNIDEQTAKNTVTRRKSPTDPLLRTHAELAMNTTWRLLQDRGYLNAEHTPSAWGKALQVAFDRNNAKEPSGKIDGPLGSRELEEAIFIAFELARLDVLNASNMFPEYSGAPMRGSETDKQYTLLISRVASLATLRHHAIGYTGPLSRHLLAYHQMTCAVRNSIRDLLDMHACRAFLSGGVERTAFKPRDFSNLAFTLPFGKEPDLGLSLAVKSYLDELSADNSNRPTNVSQWFPHSLDFAGDLEKAWKLWDAVNAGIQAAAASGLVKNDIKNLFENANTWLHTKLQEAPKFELANDGSG